MNPYWWITPIIGAGIGWGTNYLAIKMLFRPKKAWNLGILKIQGVVPRRKKALAKSIAETIDDKLFSAKDLAALCHDVDLGHSLEGLLDQKIDSFLADLKKDQPMLGMFLGGELTTKIKRKLIAHIGQSDADIKHVLAEALEGHILLHQIIEEKVEGFSLEELESMVLHVAQKELKTIEVLGGVLGFLIGLVQVLSYYYFS